MPHFLTDAFANFSIKKLIHYLLAISMLMSCHNIRSDRPNSNAATLAGRARSIAEKTSDTAGAPLTIVNWNIEWLGSTRNGPKNKEQQLAGAAKILQYLHADIYGLCEIVDPAAVKTLTTALGKNYQYVLSDYASGVRTNRDQGYPEAQKLAYIYNTRIFSSVKAGALLQENARAGYYFAGGRYPYQLTASITLNGVTENIILLLLHAKSGADGSSYQRRLQAATLLKSKLDKDFKEQPFIILGDFNDELDGSITPGKASPYAAFLKDPGYHALSWVANEKENSTLDFPSVIDQQIISAALNKYYVSGSTRIRKDVVKVVPDFLRGTVSDHYPVSSEFLLTAARQAQPSLLAKAQQAGALASRTNRTGPSTPSFPSEEKATGPTAFTAKLAEKSIEIQTDTKTQNIQFILYNARHNKVLSVRRKYILKGDTFVLRTPKLYPGDYSLVIFSDHGKQVMAIHQP